MFTFRQTLRSSHFFRYKLTPAPIREGKSYVALTGKSLGTPGHDGRRLVRSVLMRFCSSRIHPTFVLYLIFLLFAPLHYLKYYLLFQLKALQPLKPWPHHVVDHRDGIPAEELGVLVNQVLKNKHPIKRRKLAGYSQ